MPFLKKQNQQKKVINTRFQEQWLRKKVALKKRIKQFKEKGREKMIIMFVPHSEKKILNFHFSNFSLFFLGLFIIATIFLSIVFINNLKTSQTEISKYSKTSHYNKLLIQSFKNSSEFTIKNMQTLFQQVNMLSANLYRKNSSQKNILLPPPNNKTIDQEKDTPKVCLHNLKKISFQLKQSTKQFKNMRRLFENVKKRLRHTPSIWPVIGGGHITSPYGERPSPFTGIPVKHSGVDIAWWPGSPIRSTANGTVLAAKTLGGYGLCILIKHRYGYQTRYAHLQNAWVKAGDIIKKGQIIGNMGNSGFATGYHLHYEVILNNETIDPEHFLVAKFQ